MNIGIYVYPEAEVLDFAGPFEVFSTAKRLASHDWQVFLIAEHDKLIQARGGFSVQPHYTINNHPALDLLIVVGGDHRQQVVSQPVISWLQQVAPDTPRVASVCTGAFLLAQAGLLDGLEVTTHWEDVDALRQYPALTVLDDRRWVAQGKWTTSAGISAGIDMSLFLVTQLADKSLAVCTAKQMDYRWIENG